MKTKVVHSVQKKRTQFRFEVRTLHRKSWLSPFRRWHTVARRHTEMGAVNFADELASFDTTRIGLKIRVVDRGE